MDSIMRIIYLFLGVLFAVKVSCATSDEVKDIVKSYDGGDFNMVNMEVLKQNRDTLYYLSEIPEFHKNATLLNAYIIISEQSLDKEKLINNFYYVLCLRDESTKYPDRWEEIFSTFLNKFAKVYEIPLAFVKEIFKDDLKGPSMWNWDEYDLNEYTDHLSTIKKLLETCKEKISAGIHSDCLSN